MNPLRIGKIALYGNANALIVHIGIARYLRNFFEDLPIVVKITGKTSLCKKNNQPLVTSVKEAESIGAVGVGYTVYVGSDYEDIMLNNLTKVKEECIKRKMPLIGFMYPRVDGKKSVGVKDVEYAARVGAELGVDIVKTYYTGSKDSFSKVVKTSEFVPVVAAGGEIKGNEQDFFIMASDVLKSGAAGMAVGRNVWERENGIEVLKKLRMIINNGVL